MRTLPLRAALVACLLSCACIFDAAVPADTPLTCVDDSECPEPRRCQPAIGRCVDPEVFDNVLPDLVNRAVPITLSAPADPLIQEVGVVVAGVDRFPFPTALGVGGTARLKFETTEPLRNCVLRTEPALQCRVESATATVFDFACKVEDGADIDGSDVAFTAELVDVSGNRASIPLSGTVLVDTTPPPRPEPTQIVYVRAPWGTLDAPAPVHAAVGGATAAPDSVAVVVRASGARTVALVAPDGAFDATGLADVPPGTVVEVIAVDTAGNASEPARIAREQFHATLHGKVAGSIVENPHVLASVGALGTGALRSDRQELSAPSADAPVVVGGAAAWRRSSDPIPGVFGRPLLLADPVRGRMLRFGGLVQQEVFVELIGQPQIVGPALGINDAWEWNGIGWNITEAQDPEGDDRPAGRVAAAGAVDVHRGLIYVHGGNLAGSDPAVVDPDSGAVLDDTWVWDGVSWRQAATGGPPLRGAVAFVDRSGALVVAGGAPSVGGDEPPPSACTWRLNQGSWDSTCPGDADANGLLSAVAFAAAAYDYADGVLWVFGGTRPDGQVTNELLMGDGRFALVATTSSPPPRTNAAAAWDDTRRELIVFGGLDSSGQPLADLWRYRVADAEWAEDVVDLQPPPTGLVNPVMAWDDARGELVLQGTEPPVGVNGRPRVRTIIWARGPDAWSERSDYMLPAAAFHPTLVCADEFVGCVMFDNGGILGEPVHHDGFGWRRDGPIVDMLRPPANLQTRRVDQVVWDDANETLIALNRGVTLEWTLASGWRQADQNAPLRNPSSALAVTKAGVVLANTATGVVFRRVGTSWQAIGSPQLDGAALGPVQWFGIANGADDAEVFGLKITELRDRVFDGSDGGPAFCPFPGPPPTFCVTLALPAPVPTVAKRWQLVDASSPTLGEAQTADRFSAVSATARDDVRSASLFFGGVGLASDKPSPLLLTRRDGDDHPSANNVSNRDGDGFPAGRVAAALAPRSSSADHLLVGGSTSVEEWGLFQSGMIADLDFESLGVIIVGCGFPARVLLEGVAGQQAVEACSERELRKLAPKADLQDTWILSNVGEQPALLMDFDLALLGLGTGSIAEALLVVEAGADGFDVATGAPLAGAAIAVWNGTRFVRAPDATNAASTNTPTQVAIDVAAIVDVSRLARERTPLRVAVVPRGGNGAVDATLALSAVELVVDVAR